jgi:hypothetical protein
MPRRFLDDPPLDTNAALTLERSAQDVRVESHSARPLDPAALRIDPHLLEDLTILVDRIEDPAACERCAEVDVLDDPVCTSRSARPGNEPATSSPVAIAMTAPPSPRGVPLQRLAPWGVALVRRPSTAPLA